MSQEVERIRVAKVLLYTILWVPIVSMFITQSVMAPIALLGGISASCGIEMVVGE